VKGASVSLTSRLRAMARAKLFPAPQTGQGGGARHVWINLAMEGTLWWNKGYIHTTVDLNSWWLVQGCEKWAPLRVVAKEILANNQVMNAELQLFKMVDDVEAEILLFLLADGKGQVAMPGCARFAITKPDASVFHACGDNNATVRALFGQGSTIAALGIALGLSASAILGHIPPDQRIPDFGLHGVARMLPCALNGMVALMLHSRMVQGAGPLTKIDCQKTLQAVLNTARLNSGNRIKAEMRAKTRNKCMRIETTAALHIMRKRRWVPLLAGIVKKYITAWFEGFSTTCDLVWKKEVYAGTDLEDMLTGLKVMGQVHVRLRFKIILWTNGGGRQNGDRR
jgi:hypothetical protein